MLERFDLYESEYYACDDEGAVNKEEKPFRKMVDEIAKECRNDVGLWDDDGMIPNLYFLTEVITHIVAALVVRYYVPIHALGR